MGFNLLEKRQHLLKERFRDGFSTPRLAVTLFKAEDLREMGEGAADVWRFSQGIDSTRAAGVWLSGCLDDPARAALAVRERATGVLAGFCVLTQWSQGRVEVGGWLSVIFWGQGLGSEFLDALKRRMTDATGRCPLVAEVDAANGAAIHLLQRAGFVVENRVWVVSGGGTSVVS